MNRYMLDTNICIELIRRKDPNILKRLAACEIGSVSLSVIALAELEYGVEKSTYPAQNRIALAAFCAPFSIAAFTEKAATIFGKIRASLERLGKTISPYNMLIAAHALADNCILVTNNEREFERIHGLSIENWTK